MKERKKKKEIKNRKKKKRREKNKKEKEDWDYVINTKKKWKNRKIKFLIFNELSI